MSTPSALPRSPTRNSSSATSIFACDGKTLRRSFDTLQDRKAAHILSVFAQGEQIILAHAIIDEKSNEIPAFQQLIEELNLTGAVFTVDALHTQKKQQKP
jgi:hypothetical protein